MVARRHQKSHIRAILVFSLSLLYCFPLFSQEIQAFKATCLNLLRPEANTFLFLDLSSALVGVSADGYVESDIAVEVGFRRVGERAFFLERKLHDPVRSDFLSNTDPSFREYSFQVPPGSYEVVVDLRDLKTNRNHLVVIPYDCGDFSGTGLSDIMMLQEMKGVVASKILVGEEIGGISDRIRFNVELYGKAGDVLTARAVLYKQVQQARNADDGESMQVLQYTSVVQLNEVLTLEDGTATFNDGLDLYELDPGRYLFEIFLYRDDSLVGEKNCSFELPWKRIKEIFSNLDTSIAMMAHAAPAETIEELRGISDGDEKLQRFLDFWDQRAEPGLETGSEVLERYYFRIFHANEYFPEDKPGWKTDRGRIFTLYGPPDDLKSIEHSRKQYEVWTYEQWRMRFLFAKVGRGWQLAYP